MCAERILLASGLAGYWHSLQVGSAKIDDGVVAGLDKNREASAPQPPLEPR